MQDRNSRPLGAMSMTLDIRSKKCHAVSLEL
jgi:hypothetical protein